MTKRDHMTEAMIRGYFGYWLEDKTPKEIAKIYGVSYKTVLNYLGEIAANHDCQREDLLERPRYNDPKVIRERRTRDKADADEIICGIHDAIKSIGSTMHQIDRMIGRLNVDAVI